MPDAFDTMEEGAGHDLTLVSGPIAGVSTYYCEYCGALVMLKAMEVVLFHLPAGSASTAERCLGFVTVHGLLYDKLKALHEADYARMLAEI